MIRRNLAVLSLFAALQAACVANTRPSKALYELPSYSGWHERYPVPASQVAPLLPPIFERLRWTILERPKIAAGAWYLEAPSVTFNEYAQWARVVVTDLPETGQCDVGVETLSQRPYATDASTSITARLVHVYLLVSVYRSMEVSHQ